MTDNEKHTIRKLFLKLLMAVGMLVVLDVIYYFTLYPKDRAENCTLLEISERAREGVDIVYLGESSNHTYSDDDTDKRFICEMIDDLLPEHHVGNLAKDVHGSGTVVEQRSIQVEDDHRGGLALCFDVNSVENALQMKVLAVLVFLGPIGQYGLVGVHVRFPFKMVIQKASLSPRWSIL